MTDVRGLPVVTFNAVGAMPTERTHLGNRCLAAAAKKGALLIGVECDDLEPAAVLDPDVWWWKHRQADVKDGGFLAGLKQRTSVSDVRALHGAPASPVNAERYFLRGVIKVDDDWSFTAASYHSPRWKAGGFEAATTMLIRSQTIDADLLAGDLNIRNAAVRKRYPHRVVRSAEVMHMVARERRLKLGNAHPFNLLDDTEADDHPGLRVVVSPR
jgi:hypothetical protein